MVILFVDHKQKKGCTIYQEKKITLPNINIDMGIKCCIIAGTFNANIQSTIRSGL